MSNPSHIKDLDLVYKRWEMASFGNNPARASQDKSAQPVLNAVPVYTPPPEPVRSEDKAHFASMMAKFGEALERADEKIAHEVLSLAADIAQAMLSVKLNISEQAVLPIVKEAIGRLPHQTEGMKLKVNPEDVRLLNEHLADEIAKHHWQVIGDLRIARGGCVVETPANLVDATNGARWKQISEALALQKDWMGE